GRLQRLWELGLGLAGQRLESGRARAARLIRDDGSAAASYPDARGRPLDRSDRTVPVALLFFIAGKGEERHDDPYSALRAMTGSTRVARTPGTDAAVAATKPSTAATAAKVTGSDGRMPKSRVRIRPVNSIAPAPPITRPAAARPSAWPTTIDNT